MSWTKERMALLKKMWLQGKSAAEIAKKLGQGMTRNAVIGKAHRMGLSGGRPATPAKAAPVTAVVAKGKKGKIVKPEPVAVVAKIPKGAVKGAKGKAAPLPVVISNKKSKEAEALEPAPLPASSKKQLTMKEANGITLLEVNDRVCRWPTGDPRDDGFYFCGRNVHAGMPYCRDHAMQAYQSISRKPANEDVVEEVPAVEEEEEITTT